MAQENGAIRTVGVNGSEFTFERMDHPMVGRKMGDRKLAAVWTTGLPDGRNGFVTASVNEFDDGVLYGPSSVPGAVSDFAGSAAAEVTIRWLEITNQQLIAKAVRQRDMMMVAAGVSAALLIVAIAFR